MDGTPPSPRHLFLFKTGILRKVSAFAGFFLLSLFLVSIIAFSAKNTLQLVETSFYELGKNPGYIPSGKRLRPALLGFDHFVADLYWIRAIQYAGAHAGTFNATSLPKYIDTVTDLDPHFIEAYLFGSRVYTLNDEIKDKIFPLLKKGIRNNPGKKGLGRLYTELAYHTYYDLEQYEKAAQLYDICAEKIADCPAHAARTAKSLRARTGRYTLALQKWMDDILEGDNDKKSSEQLDLEFKRIEEAAKLVALKCAQKNYTFAGNTIEKVEDLLGQSVSPCPDFAALDDKYKGYIFKKNEEYGLSTISEKTLTNPFGIPFEWNAKKNRITAGKYWQ